MTVFCLGDQKFVRRRAVREHRPVGRAGAGGSEKSRIMSPYPGSTRGQQVAGASPGSGYSGGLRLAQLNQRGVRAVGYRARRCRILARHCGYGC
jgi:hypothetical protein